MINYGYEDRYLAKKLSAWLKVHSDGEYTKQESLVSVLKDQILSKETDEKRKKKVIDQSKVSNIIKAAYGRIGFVDGYYQYISKPIYNGLNGNGLVALIDVQRNYGAFRNPYIMCPLPNVLLLEVSRKFRERVVDSIKKFLTCRYLYDIDFFGNHIVIILIPDDDRERCNAPLRGMSNRTFMYQSISLDRANTSNPVLDKGDYDGGIQKGNNQELSCNEIRKMFEAVTAVKKKYSTKK